eukprot:scaffold74545_cov37-Tisochrysis_lutea.AAC.2
MTRIEKRKKTRRHKTSFSAFHLGVPLFARCERKYSLLIVDINGSDLEYRRFPRRGLPANH